MEAGDILMRRSLTDHAPAAQVHVIEAAKALEDFRLGHGAALERAEALMDRAITTFQERSGEYDEAAWQAASVYMVELWATRFSAARLTVFDPAPPPPSRLTPAHPLRLETVSREAHEHLLRAGRSLERAPRRTDEMDVVRAQHAMHAAARLLHDQFDGLSMPLWVLIARFCAEIQAENLRILKAPAPGTTD
ncbi:hypothetical protein PZB75_30930 (plasmid) [Streptomyces sp. AM 4-1-1]|uniref:hypothetical protein n=1 Tax=Streptomyces sp. AM 4-1-1 TaxID=3028710 RepID=UPI0023B8B46F|nr:hypothetical protein [Streptomyces sp. AM 4-1-1]WEH37819.1 hypothetical protein PZB75_30930 [Streptomyces sp. AM 4-1-1]